MGTGVRTERSYSFIWHRDKIRAARF